MRFVRPAVLMGAVALAASSVMAPTAGAADYRQLNKSERRAVVARAVEIPSWFGTVDVVSPPRGLNANTGGVTTRGFCWDVMYVPEDEQGDSSFSMSGGWDLDSNVFQYPSVAAAQAAWAELSEDLAACTGSATVVDNDSTASYAQEVRELPVLAGSPGYFVSWGVISDDPELIPFRAAAAVRVAGAAIITTSMVRMMPGSMAAARSTVSASVSSTAEVLTNRSTLRYLRMASQR